jgi:hypothetical protein
VVEVVVDEIPFQRSGRRRRRRRELSRRRQRRRKHEIKTCAEHVPALLG